MYDLIHRILDRLSLLLTPGTGQRRHSTELHSTSPTPTDSWPKPVPLPAHRSPYGLDFPLDGTASALTRPYLTAREQERSQQTQPRLALALPADFGIDFDQHLIGAQGAAV
ncbi:hypothetical protein [Streptomyces sp. NPDC058683]|uniref:hypothetical protein n=1 Tax=Streptomyces sp. NPDC058683 TaxID=3346597 RepID=UPI003663E55A